MRLNDDPSHPLYKRRPPDEELAESLRAMTYKQVAEKYNVSLHTVKNWVTRAGLARIRSPKAKPSRTDTPANKRFPGVHKLAAMLHKHTQAEIASKLGVARATVSAWVHQYDLYTRIDRPIKKPETYIPPVYPEDEIPKTVQKWTSMPLVPARKRASVVMPPVDPRDQLRLTVFDIFSETNSLYKQVLTSSGGQRGARIALRRIELSLAQADELTKKMRQLIKYYEEVDHRND